MTANNAINNTLQSPFTLGATSVTSTGTQLNLLNGLTVVPINKVIVQTFTGNGTYTPTTGMQFCQIECIGGGGAGGGAANSATIVGCGSGGGAGSYSRKVSTAATIGVSQSVTVGAGGTPGSVGNNPGGNGGDTSVGSICIGKGGTGGGGSDAASGTFTMGGAGGVAGTGDFTPVGEYGDSGLDSTAVGVTGWNSAKGGSSVFGAGGASVSVNVAATAGQNYGSGGAGACTFNSAALAGGAGSAGVVIITEFVSA